MNVRVNKILPLAVLVTALVSGKQVLAEALNPIVAAVGPESDLPVGILNARWVAAQPGINVLTFRNMDELFTIRKVPHSGPVFQLKRNDKDLNFTYTFEGESLSPETFLTRTYTNALLIYKNGEVVYERYLNNANDRSRFIGFSMTKSITSMLIGSMLQEQKIGSLDDEITDYLPELAHGAYRGVTIRQILSMRSGVSYPERYDFHNPGIAATNHIVSLVKNVVRFVDVAETIERAHPPGEFYEYKTIDTAVLGLLIERLTDGGSLSSYMASHLWEPLGAESDGFFMMDGVPGEGREFAGAGFNATLRDFARLGILMLNKGAINGKQILSPEWVSLSTKSVGPEDRQDGPGGYGYQWWTFADSEAYAAIGLQGQYIYVDPATGTVVVKLSYFPPGDYRELSAETFEFLTAVSAWNSEE